MKTPFSNKIILLAAIALPLFAGCASHRPVDVAPQVASADNIYTGAPTQPPPDNQRDVIPTAPGPRTLWYFIPGHWEWRGQYAWVAGHWRTRPHPGDIWLAGKWVKKNDQNSQTIYVWQSGHWRSEAPADKESTDK